MHYLEMNGKDYSFFTKNFTFMFYGSHKIGIFNKSDTHIIPGSVIEISKALLLWSKIYIMLLSSMVTDMLQWDLSFISKPPTNLNSTSQEPPSFSRASGT